MDDDSTLMVANPEIDYCVFDFLVRVSAIAGPLTRFEVHPLFWHKLARETSYGTAPGSEYRDDGLWIRTPHGARRVDVLQDDDLLSGSVAWHATGRHVRLDMTAF